MLNSECKIPLKFRFHRDRAGDVKVHADSYFRCSKYLNDCSAKHLDTFRDTQEQAIRKCADEFWDYLHDPVYRILTTLARRTNSVETCTLIQDARTELYNKREVFKVACIEAADYSVEPPAENCKVITDNDETSIEDLKK